VLSKHGEDQAVELGEYVQSITPKIDRIYSSPFYRCLQTATPASEKLNLDIYPETGFGEWYKRERTTHPSAASPLKLKQFFSNLKQDYESLVKVPSQGETQQELEERCKEAFKMVLKDLNDNAPEVKTILVVSHAAPRIALARALAGDNTLPIRTGVCSLDKFVLKPHQQPTIGNYQLEYTGKTDFLKDGEEMHWSFENPFDPGSTEDIMARVSDTESEERLENTKEGSEETATVYVPLDMGQDVFGPLSESVIPVGASFQMVDIESDKPMFKIGEKVFEGDWQNMVGTEVYTDTEGLPVGTSRTRIQLYPATLQEKSEEGKAPAKRGGLLGRVQEINLKRQAKELSINGNSENGHGN
jgi:transcription factor C subunit 7